MEQPFVMTISHRVFVLHASGVFPSYCCSSVSSSDMCHPFVEMCQRTGCPPPSPPGLPPLSAFVSISCQMLGFRALTRQPWKWKCKRSVIYHPSPAVLCLEVSPPITGQDHRKLPSVGTMVTRLVDGGCSWCVIWCKWSIGVGGEWGPGGGLGGVARRCGDGNNEMVRATGRRTKS